LEKAIW